MLTEIKGLFSLNMIKNKELIRRLAVNDFKVRYVNSYLGAIWAFVQPAVTIFVFWFVFQVGFKTPPIQNFPFVLWLLCGIIPWFYFSEALSNAANSLIEYNYLVKKVVFRVSILPVVKILSSLIVHLFFISVIFMMFFLYGYKFDIYNIQIIYYLMCTIILLLGLSWLTSSISVLLKDTSQIISIIIQLGFWFTPIFWDFDKIGDKYKPIFLCNPMFYIVQGYRDTFINKIWFWEKMGLTIYFWMITLVVFVTGVLIFKKLRPHFSDML